MINRYVCEMTKAGSTMKNRLLWRGFIFALGQAIPFVSYGITLWYGGLLIADRKIEYKDVLKLSQSLLAGIFTLGQTMIFAPTITAACFGAHFLFKIIDREPMVCSPIVANKYRKADRSNDIEFKNVDFHYPTRPDTKILENFKLHVTDGKTIAFVGPSGKIYLNLFSATQAIYVFFKSIVFCRLW